MKRVFLVSLLTLVTGMIYASSHVIVVEGQYQNKNVYVSNSLSDAGIGFCAYEIRVNGKITADEVNSSAFEIDLAAQNIEQGTQVVIEIFHKSGCVPKVLNSSVLKPQPTFNTKEITLSEAGMLKWTTTGESGVLAFEIEQYKWNKWIKVGEVQGIGTDKENTYQFQVNLVSGLNRFRVIQKGNLGKVQRSPAVDINSKQEKPDFKVHSKEQSISFTTSTSYEVYDEYGQIRKRGFGTNVDIANLAKGTYYLSYDNYVETIKKK
ncbi:MAG: hypothetical protein ACHQF2_08345 [Flavobacteriales bacterium]